MKKIICIIVILIITFNVSFIFNKKISFSESENRYLTSFPEFCIDSLLSGDYISNIESYINDHFPLRSTFLSFKTDLELLLNKSKINNVYVNKDNMFLEYNSVSNKKDIVDVINKFNESINIKNSLLLVPSSGVINSNLLPSYVSYDKEVSDYNYICNNVSFGCVNVIDGLKEDSMDTNLYFKTDHHYNIYGAYSVYKSFIKDYKKLEFTLASDKFNGTLGSKTNIYNIYDKLYYYEPLYDISVKYFNKDNTINTLYDESYSNKKDKYSYYFGGNHALFTIEVNNNLDKEILILKDSFANSMIPFLTNHFSKIHVIDLRFYNVAVSDYVRDNNIGEVLFLYSVNGLNESSITKLR